MSRNNLSRVLTSIQNTAEKHPRLRLGQLLCLAMRENGSGLDLFHVSDDELAVLVEALGQRSIRPE